MLKNLLRQTDTIFRFGGDGVSEIQIMPPAFR
jgi:hypothetical protein